MRIICVLALAAAASCAWAQDERIPVPLSDPSRPATVRANLLNGGITVRAYQGKEVIIEAHGGSRRHKPNETRPGDEGMHRIDMQRGFEVEEQDNVVTIKNGGVFGNLNLDIQVPVNTSVNLRTMNNGGIQVDGVAGEVDVNSLNGSIEINNVSGPVLAHCLNGPVKVTLDRIAPGKAMSFSSLNGTIDVTAPADLKANVKMKSENGEILTDFEITMKPSLPPSSERSEGRYRVRVDKTFNGTINGGGPEMQFTTLNGRIYLRKKK